jgi:transposase
MMKKHSPDEADLFIYNFNLDKKVPHDHPLRAVLRAVDFDFIYDEVAHLYGTTGNPSVPPPIILKLMFLLFYYDAPSERELMRMLPLRLDWLWFLGLGIDSPVPDHSVLSKARARWGEEAFRKFFAHVITQCARAGLIEGKTVFADASLVRANASKDSVIDRRLEKYAEKKYRQLERRLDEPVGRRSLVSTTDPEAAVVKKGKGHKAQPSYAEHRAVDAKAGIVTATVTTPGSVNEAHLLTELLDEHRANTHCTAEVAVADSKYGTTENFLKLHDRGVRAHMPKLSELQKGSSRREGIFDISEFIYDEATDTYTCPAGKQLHRKKHKKKRKAHEYSAHKKICQQCALRDRCTRSSGARTIKRHHRQKELDRMQRISHSAWAKRDIRRRKHVMEGSFADAANNHGFKRSRWRGLQRATIQNLIIAAVQNIRKLITYAAAPAGEAQEVWEQVKKHHPECSTPRDCRAALIRPSAYLFLFRRVLLLKPSFRSL